ncbi:MAG: hypothetical protein FWJ62_02255 [Thermaerobacter sp.]|nr:hypothetical protein [Bacillota bacterium]
MTERGRDAVGQDDERLRVLKLIESGQISAEEGLRLLEAVEHGGAAGEEAPAPRWLRIRVEGDDEKINVNLPLEAVEMIAGLVARFLPRDVFGSGDQVDPAHIIRLVRAGARGRIVHVENDDQHVEIFVE